MIESVDAAGVLIARVNDSGRLPEADVTASHTSRVTTWSSSTTNRDGSQPCSASGSAGNGTSREPRSGNSIRSWYTWHRSASSGDSWIMRTAMRNRIMA